jgi:hypothetical protein
MTRRTRGSRAGRRLSLLGLAAVLAGVMLLVVVGVLALVGDGGAATPPAGFASIPRSEIPIEVRSHQPRRQRHTRVRRPRRVLRPVALEIPAIDVRARVIKLGLNRDRTLEVPTNVAETGWWTGGARPGERGPAIIAGHVDGNTGPAVFYNLPDLRRGNVIIVVRRDGSRARFTVQRSERYSKSRFPTARVYGMTRRPTLRLITCSGDFDRSTGHYLDNTVVYATLA